MTRRFPLMHGRIRFPVGYCHPSGDRSPCALRFLLLLPLLVCGFVADGASAQEKPKSTRNDSIYPPAAVARPFIDFDGKGFIIAGKRTFLSSGSIHYPRVPRALWDDRMLRMQQADFNCIQTYAFWNYQEPRENEFDFNGDKDIGAFFDAAKRHGLYGIARVGPYVCAEWDFGGYPGVVEVQGRDERAHRRPALPRAQRPLVRQDFLGPGPAPDQPRREHRPRATRKRTPRWVGAWWTISRTSSICGRPRCGTAWKCLPS